MKLFANSVLLLCLIVVTTQDITGRKGCDCSICKGDNNKINPIVGKKLKEDGGGGKSSCNLCERRKELLRMEKERQQKLQKCPFEILGSPAIKGKSSQEVFDEFRELVIPSQNGFFDMMRGIVKTMHVSSETELKWAKEKEAKELAKKKKEEEEARKRKESQPNKDEMVKLHNPVSPKVTVVLKQTPCGQIIPPAETSGPEKIPLTKRLSQEPNKFPEEEGLDLQQLDLEELKDYFGLSSKDLLNSDLIDQLIGYNMVTDVPNPENINTGPERADNVQSTDYKMSDVPADYKEAIASIPEYNNNLQFPNYNTLDDVPVRKETSVPTYKEKSNVNWSGYNILGNVPSHIRKLFTGEPKTLKEESNIQLNEYNIPSVKLPDSLPLFSDQSNVQLTNSEENVFIQNEKPYNTVPTKNSNIPLTNLMLGKVPFQIKKLFNRVSEVIPIFTGTSNLQNKKTITSVPETVPTYDQNTYNQFTDILPSGNEFTEYKENTNPQSTDYNTPILGTVPTFEQQNYNQQTDITSQNTIVPENNYPAPTTESPLVKFVSNEEIKAERGSNDYIGHNLLPTSLGVDIQGLKTHQNPQNLFSTIPDTTQYETNHLN